MVSSQRKNAPAAEEIEITLAISVEQVGTLRLAEADVVAERLQDPHHLTVQIARMQRITLGFAFSVGSREIKGQVRLRVMHVGRAQEQASCRSALSRRLPRTEAEP